MNSRVLGAIARLLTPWRAISQLESEVARLKEIIANPYLVGVQIGKETGIEVELQGIGPQLLAGMFEGLLEKDGANAPNYLELQFYTRHQGKILVHVQRLSGKSPHALRMQAEERATVWQAIAEKLLAAAKPILNRVCAADLDSINDWDKAALEAAITRAQARKAYEAMQSTDGPAVPQGREPASVNGTLSQHRAGAEPPVHIEPLHAVCSEPADQPLQVADVIEPDASGGAG